MGVICPENTESGEVEHEARDRKDEDDGEVREGERKEEKGELEAVDDDDDVNWKEDAEDELDKDAEMEREFSDE